MITCYAGVVKRVTDISGCRVCSKESGEVESVVVWLADRWIVCAIYASIEETLRDEEIVFSIVRANRIRADAVVGGYPGLRLTRT